MPRENLIDYFNEKIGRDGWDEPIPLQTRTDVPPFPVGVLPGWMQRHVLAVADEQQVAPDLPAMLSIVALAAVNAARYRIHIQGEWHETVNIYIVVALPPSAGKSPVFKRMFRALEQYEADLVAEAIERRAHVDQRRRMIERRMNDAERKGDHQEAAIALDELAATPPVVIPRLVADDTTVEALVDLLHEQGGRLALLSTEGGLFDAMAGRYSDKSNLDPYLQAWSGDTIRTDRVSRGYTVVRNPLLTIGLTVQPSVIEALAAKPEFAGRGLTARFMFSIPADWVGTRDFMQRRYADTEAADDYDRHLAAMLAAPIPEQPATLELDPEAWQMFAEWRQGLEARRGPNGDLRPMATWTTKLESSVARLAALLHIADGAAGDVAAATMRRALDVGGYWMAHAQIVHDMWGSNPTIAAAKVIVRWISENKLSEFSVRDVYRARPELFPNAEDTVEPLELLTERGWIRPLFDGKLSTGRRGVESPRFQSYPQLLRDRNDHVSHVSHVTKDKKSELSISLRLEGAGVGTGDMTDMTDNPPSNSTPKAHPF